MKFCKFLLSLILLSPVLLLSDTTLAPPIINPYISSVTPGKIITTHPPNPAEILIKGGGFIPAGAPLSDLNYQKAFVRMGNSGNWLNAPVKIPGPYGRGANQFSASLPSMTYVSGVLQVRVAVRGVESGIFQVPVVPPAPPARPAISSIYPSETALGQNGYYFIIKIYGSGIDEHTVPIFQGIPKPTQMTNYVEQRTQVGVPDEFRFKPGRYSIQLSNNQGVSNTVFWDLVMRPRIVSNDPTVLTALMMKPGAPPVAMKIGFKKSPPNKVWYRADDRPWQSTASFNISGYSVQFNLNMKVLKPEQYMEIKLSNLAGESAPIRITVLKYKIIKIRKKP